MTRTCQPASAMLPPELAPRRVGLVELVIVRQGREVGGSSYPKQIARLPAFMRF